MGASGSVINKIYLSCPNKSSNHVIELKRKIKSLNCMIIDDVENDNLYNYISNVNYVLICMFPDTIRDYNQIIDINYSLELEKKIIFICMDDNYTINTYPHLKGLIKENHNINCCNINDIDLTCEEIQRIFTIN